MLHSIIIDDERRSRESLKYLIENNAADILVLGMADGIKSGIEAIDKYDPDLVFLDIKMKIGTGFDLLNQIVEHNFQVIFTTAYNEYAIKAFKFNAIDYLLKPIDTEDLKRAINKAIKSKATIKNEELNRLMMNNLSQFNKDDPKIAVSTNDSYEFVRVSEIIRIEADGAYAKLFLESGKTLMTSRLLKEFESILEEYNFYRVHHSHLVNTNKMVRFNKADGGSIVMTNGSGIPVSRRKKDHFLEQYVKKFLNG